MQKDDSSGIAGSWASFSYKMALFFPNGAKLLLPLFAFALQLWRSTQNVIEGDVGIE